jgi:hypothetical protein
VRSLASTESLGVRMTKVLSLRLPTSLARTVRIHASRMNRVLPAVVGSILEIPSAVSTAFLRCRIVPNPWTQNSMSGCPPSS